MKRIFLVLLTLTAATACSKPDEGADPRERVLHSWWDHFLGPELEELKVETSALSERVGEFCATLSDPSLDAAQLQWAKAHRIVKRQEIFNFGPYAEEPLRFKVKLDFWPARPTSIEKTAENDAIDFAAAAATLAGPSRGLPVIEYLLWETESWTPRRCEYLQALADDAHVQAVALRDAWDPELDGYYAELLDPHSGGDFKTLVLSVSAVINRLWFTVENIHLMKLGTPLFTAADGGTAQPDTAEARFSGRSIDAIRDNLDAVEFLYFGDDVATGIAEFVPATQSSLNDDLRTELGAVRQALDAIDVPLTEAVVAKPDKVADAIEALERLQRLIEVDAISALGLRSPYVFENHVAVWTRADGLSQIEVHDLNTGDVHRVDFPEDAYAIWPAHNFTYDTTRLRFSYSSLITPRSVYAVDMKSRELELIKQRDVPGYDASKYETTRITTRTYDGTRVPISLVYRKGARDNGPAPLLLKGYGSYGATYDPSFTATNLPLLDRGVILGIAHVRGGGENGRAWYEAGKYLNKKNTFTDFIAAGAELVAQDWTKPHLLAASGRSAGGLLMGAVANMRPDLFKVIVAGVPFVDVLNTMLDPTIPLTVTEWEEWGNPQTKEYFDYIKSYAPYENIEPTAYPHMLVTAGLNDPRVAYWEPAKWVARLRATATPANTLLLKTNMGSGHGGASGRYDYLKEIAFEEAFILQHLGVAPAQGCE